MDLEITSFCNASMNSGVHKLVGNTKFPFFTYYPIIDVFAKTLERQRVIKF